MHDLDFDHGHVSAEEQQAIAEVIWAADNVELTTVGIDVGSSTSHLMFARVHLRRLATALSRRFVVVEARGAVALADPAHAVSSRQHHRRWQAGELLRGGVSRKPGSPATKIDSGAVILTGEALKRNNARAIADLFAAESGKFVCASAGHHMECAHGRPRLRRRGALARESRRR